MKRYAVLTFHGVPKMCEAPNGDFVKYEDAAPDERLRDEFAIAAMQHFTFHDGDDQDARRCYEIADAMLEARNANR